MIIAYCGNSLSPHRFMAREKLSDNLILTALLLGRLMGALRVSCSISLFYTPRQSTKRKHESEKQVSGHCCHSRGHSSRLRSFSTRSNHHNQNRPSVLYTRRHWNALH